MKIKRYISLLLLSLFISAITPDVFIHVFAGHHDTDEHFHSANELNISEQHVHCKSLQDNLPVFSATQTVSLEAISFLLNTKVIAPILFAEQLFQFHFSSRGPPSLLS